MQQLIEQLSQTIHKKNIQSCLIGYSGGIDSTVLLDLFALLQQKIPSLQIRAIHINHNLSKNASMWAKHCQQICAKRQIALITETVNVDKTQGIESGARKARYQTIQRHIKPNEIFITAHHLNDKAENFLLAVKRNAGPKGLASLKTFTNIFNLNIWRPLLTTSRDAIEKYAVINKLSWIEDESNIDTNFDRNFIRLQILPLLAERWPGFTKSLAKSSWLCEQQEELLNELLLPQLKLLLDTQGNLYINDFNHYSKPRSYYLLRMWFEFHQQPMPSSIQLQAIIDNVINAAIDRSPEFKLNNKVIRRYKNKLYLGTKLQNLAKIVIKLIPPQKIKLPDELGTINIERLASQQIKLVWQRNGYTQTFALPKCNTSTNITLKFGYHGKIQLTSKQPHKDIKHIFQQHLIPPWERPRIPFIYYEEDLIAALGIFIKKM